MNQIKQIKFVTKNNLPLTNMWPYNLLNVDCESFILKRVTLMCFSHINACRVRLFNECNPPCRAAILALLQHIWMVCQIVLEQCSLVIPVKIRLSYAFLPVVPMSFPPFFEWCNCLANIGCWAVWFIIHIFCVKIGQYNKSYKGK